MTAIATQVESSPVTRIACIFTPAFPLAALLRTTPELRGTILAVAERDDGRAPLLAVSPEAHKVGIRIGQSVARARALDASLAVHLVSAEVLAAANEALADVATSFSPNVEHRSDADGDGIVYFDAAGLGSLHESEQALASAVAAAAVPLGLDVWVGIASSKRTALLAARHGLGGLDPREGTRRIGALALEALDPSPRLAKTLDRWGLRTLGDLARLPQASVVEKLGKAGLALWHEARGDDATPFLPSPRPIAFEEATDCEYGITSFEPLSFLLRTALERLVARLDLRALRAGDLRLSLALEGHARDERVIRVAAPTREIKVLLTLMRINLEGTPPRAPIESFRLAAIPERIRPIELDLFAPTGPAPEDVDAAVARLSALTGETAVGCPVTRDSHRPDAFAIERFVPPTPGRSQHAVPRSEMPTLALRAFRPPVELEVAYDRGQPSYMRSTKATHPLGGRIVTLAGPWRLRGEWWNERRYGVDIYDVELSDGGIYRVHCQHDDGVWLADGTYD